MKQNRKVILITGAATGIGSSIAKSYIDEGHNVHICDYDKKRLQEFLDKNPNATGNLADVSNPDDVKDTFHIINNLYNKLNILINNAGISGESALTENISIEGWQQTINTNLNGMFYVTKLAIPLLKENKSSSIINMSSTAGLLGVPMRSPYAASKWAVIGFTKTTAMELGPYGVNVNAICPGCVDGDRIERVINADARESGNTPDQIRDVYLRQSSMRKFMSKKDIADMVLFLTSSSGSKISGQAIAIDGHTEGFINWLD